MLKDKTRILVTHSAKYLPQMDRIFVLKDGQISEEGNYQELLEAGGAFADFLVQYLTKAEEDEDLQNDVESESELESLKEVFHSVEKREIYFTQCELWKFHNFSVSQILR